MALTLALVTGGTNEGLSADSEPPRARLTSVSGDHVTLHSTCPAPPGAPLMLRDSDQHIFEARTRGCRRYHQRGFVLEARLVNMSRQDRVRLQQLMNQSEPQN
jgi:hypothetical protein